MVLLYIMIFFNFSQPEANYTIECIILIYTFIVIHTVHSYEVYFQTFMTAAVIVILVNIVLISTAYRLVYQASCLSQTSDLVPFLGSNSGKVSPPAEIPLLASHRLCVSNLPLLRSLPCSYWESLLCFLSFQLFFLTILFKPITYA